MAKALRLPEVIQLEQRKGKIDRRLALAILLHWLAFPIRQENDMERFWRRDRRLISRWVVCVLSDLSSGILLTDHMQPLSHARIIDDTVVAIFKKWRHLLWPGDVTRIQANIPKWQAAISRKVRLSARVPAEGVRFFGRDGAPGVQARRALHQPGGPLRWPPPHGGPRVFG